MKSRKVNLLIVGPFPEPIHGMSIANKNLYDTLRNDVDFVKVVSHNTCSKARKIDKKAQGVFNLKFFIFSLFNILACFYKIFRYRITDVYITPGQSVLGLIRFLPIILFSKIIGCKVYLHFHGSRLNYYISNATLALRALSRLTINLADRVIFLGEKIAQLDDNLVKSKKVRICQNGVKGPNSYSRDYHLSESKINVLFMSNLMRDKGVFELFSAISMLEKDDRFVFHLAGSIEKGVEEALSEIQVKYPNKVFYHGVVYGESKDNLFRQSHVLILPSFDEGQPLCIIEAYSYGLAVITTNVGGVSDIFTHGENGYLCSPGEPLSIYNCLIDLDLSTIFPVGQNNREQYEKKYKINDFVSRVKEIVEECDSV